MTYPMNHLDKKSGDSLLRCAGFWIFDVIFGGP